MLAFNSENHTYKLDGKPLPSVSEIIAPLGEDIDEGLDDVIERAAERGTVCHAVLEGLMNGEEPEYPSEYEAHIIGVRQFLAEHDIEPIAAEEPICNRELGYAGTPDLICFLDSKLTIVDYKFVAKIAKTKVKAQLNGYNLAAVEAGLEIEALRAVQFTSKGYRLYPVAFGEEEFITCLKVWQMKNKKHKRGIIE